MRLAGGRSPKKNELELFFFSVFFFFKMFSRNINYSFKIKYRGKFVLTQFINSKEIGRL